MPTSAVYFIDLRADDACSLLDKITWLLKEAGLAKRIPKRALTAVKIHFGERGNTAFVRPLLVRPIVDAIEAAGGRPFLTDAGTLYVGTRGNAVDHLVTAMRNGFVPEVVGAPVLIADGLDGRDEVAVPVCLQRCQDVYIASALARADALVSVAHFKLHELAGFGGAIKNVGMGGASRRGKLAQHSVMEPKIRPKKCIACGSCVAVCAHDALALVERPEGMARPKEAIKKVARIDPSKCVGCGSCIHACPEGAIDIQWDKDIAGFMERMVEYTVGALYRKENKSFFINFLTQISPACDCHASADAPIVADIGIMASADPVAIDQASVDMMNAQPVLANSRLGNMNPPPADKIRAVYPHIPWEHQLEYAESLGLGFRSYELITVKPPKKRKRH
ncbi:DUF362 domain-containing protein [Desulfosoma caldarium]|uniref:4Fe-4S ferredoxin-type domain-containing protein n=1 Tax=Desulfosoma caldarium TaxID=610254 RepID=A0A3N1VLF2_9BACT|nr:DUF362 domain-containing protein [Desulfosoma caldarium]ROR01791.1 hypothetical protein EDC27_0978 [Desulfosoma caldarium]